MGKKSKTLANIISTRVCSVPGAGIEPSKSNQTQINHTFHINILLQAISNILKS